MPGSVERPSLHDADECVHPWPSLDDVNVCNAGDFARQPGKLVGGSKGLPAVQAHRGDEALYGEMPTAQLWFWILDLVRVWM
jgi:hypothetical protein